MECKHCGSPYLERQRRRGLLRRWLLPLFGIYPWQCLTCYKNQFLHARRTPDGHTSTADAQG